MESHLATHTFVPWRTFSMASSFPGSFLSRAMALLTSSTIFACTCSYALTRQFDMNSFHRGVSIQTCTDDLWLLQHLL